MIEASALASFWLLAKNELRLPGELLCEADCNAPIIPPELLSLAIADWASPSQLEEVLDAIDWVAYGDTETDDTAMTVQPL